MSFWSNPLNDINKFSALTVLDPITAYAQKSVIDNQKKQNTTGAIQWNYMANQITAGNEESAANRAKEIELGLAPNSLADFKKFFADPSLATGDLLRRQDADYRETYGPIEDRLLGMTSYNNPGVANDEVAKAIGTGSLTRGQFIVDAANKGSVEPSHMGSFLDKLGIFKNNSSSPPAGAGYVQVSMDNAYGQGQRAYQRYGMAPTSRQQGAIDNNDIIKRSTGVVDAANTIRARVADRDNQIMLGMAPTSGGRNVALKSEA